MCRGTYDFPKTRACQRVPQHHGNDGRRSHQEDVEHGYDASTNEQRRQLEFSGHAHGLELGTPDDFHRVVEDEDEGVTNKQLHQHVGVVHPSHEDAFEHESEQTDAHASD